MNYGALPIVIGEQIEIDCCEFLLYQYLPIKLASSVEIKVEPRLECFSRIVGAACCDYIGLRGIDSWVASYAYLTAKHTFLPAGVNQNRPGWHSDGFMTDDINYVWCDQLPTVYNSSPFCLTLDDEISMLDMEHQAQPRLSKQFPLNTLLRLDQFCIHRCAEVPVPTLRTFVKVSISCDRYDLLGNSHNHLLEYHWPMRERALHRNVPQRLADQPGESR
jgi:hypothetical protein